MKFAVKHELAGRIRVHMWQKNMTMREADILAYYLENLPGEQIRFLVLSEVLRKVFSKKKRTVTISSGKTEEFRISTVKSQGLPRVICLSDARTDNAVCFSI